LPISSEYCSNDIKKLGVDFSSLLFISQSIGLSVLGANFLISFEQYSDDIGKIILHSLMGLLFGLMTASVVLKISFA
jgi:hypothetical protein